MSSLWERWLSPFPRFMGTVAVTFSSSTESIVTWPGTYEVFNLEVGVAHQYYVATSLVLVHNNNGITLQDLSDAAAAPDRNGFTAAGRSLTKHGAGARPGNSLFPAAKGNPPAINQTAQDIVDDILTDPNSTVQNSYRGRFGNTIEVTEPSGRGLVYDANGNFLFFKE